MTRSLKAGLATAAIAIAASFVLPANAADLNRGWQRGGSVKD